MKRSFVMLEITFDGTLSEFFPKQLQTQFPIFLVHKRAQCKTSAETWIFPKHCYENGDLKVAEIFSVNL